MLDAASCRELAEVDGAAFSHSRTQQSQSRVSSQRGEGSSGNCSLRELEQLEASHRGEGGDGDIVDVCAVKTQARDTIGNRMQVLQFGRGPADGPVVYAEPLRALVADRERRTEDVEWRPSFLLMVQERFVGGESPAYDGLDDRVPGEHARDR